jgi:hypothetical protein
MAIFKCVGYFNFHIPEGFCFAAFLSFFFHFVILCTFPFVFCSCAVFLRYFCCFLACVVCLLALSLLQKKTAKQNPSGI